MKRFGLFRLCILIFVVACSAYSQDTTSVTGELKVHYLNVGQADAVLIECPTGQHYMLIDAADTRYPGSSKMFKEAMERLFAAAEKKLDVVIASHPHADHIGNMKWVLDNFKVLRYVDDGQTSETALYENLMETVNEKTASKVMKYEPAESASKDFVDFCPANNVSATVLLTKDQFEDCSNPNDCSVVLRVDYGKTSFLFVGDTELDEEKKLLADNKIRKELNTDALKAGHHGSNTSSSLDFIKAISPQIVVVSVGKKNVGTNVGYKHPQTSSLKSFNQVLKTDKYRPDKVEVYDKTKKKWVKQAAKNGIYYTVVDGEVVIKSDGTRVWKTQ